MTGDGSKGRGCGKEVAVAECEEFQVSVPVAEPARSTAIAAITEFLNTLPGQASAEVWIDLDPQPALCVLVNGEQAWLMAIRHEGDAGFSSRNPAYDGAPEATIAYTLSNGQVDEYPAGWSHSRQTAFRAIEAFAATRRFPDTITWFNDSGDGCLSPNEGGPV